MIKEFLKLLRVSHWIKNLFVFVPVLFSKQLFNINYSGEVILAFISFSIASSMVYVFNDLRDEKEDKMHPKKRFRPIASGKISKTNAVIIIVILFALLVASVFLFNYKFIVVLFAYIIINAFYTTILRKVVVLDIICIAAGFMLRVMGGAFVINVYISKWLVLTTLFISLFLAAMKRRSELVLSIIENNTRKVLSDYSIDFANHISSISAAGVIICYALYSVAERTVQYFHTENIVYTTIFVIFGIFRYMFLAYSKEKGENTIEILFTDIPMMLNILFYILSIIGIIYFL
ncbi:MAG: decaprenyl-phosphate phosphoribosyltransferase [bacterium]